MGPWLIAIPALLIAVAGALFFFRKREDSQPETKTVEQTFIIEPYLQLGDAPQSHAAESVELFWYTADNTGVWAAEVALPDGQWRRAAEPERQKLAIEGVPVLYRWRTTFRDLTPGAEFVYRLLLAGKETFRATGKARVPAGSSYRVAVYGDLAEGGPASKLIAAAVDTTRPDLVVLAGDITYNRGRLSEYLSHFFPVYNRGSKSAEGAPLLRSRILVAAAGNHDQGIMDWRSIPDLDRFPDLMGYYIFWSQPLNGPLGRDAKSSVPVHRGSQSRKQVLLDAAGARYPRMSNFSFDWGMSHWLVLDANTYMDWTDEHLRAWVERDLAGAAWARWKFVCFHQPGFTTDVKHANEQRMRLLAEIFERHGVDIVFSGHNHTYERCYPLRFKVEPQPDGKMIDDEGRVAGSLELDRDYDGVNVTTKRGVLYLVTGGGGAKLYLTPERRADHQALPPYTYKLIDDQHSFTVMDVELDKLVLKQLAADGTVLDSFTVTK